MSILFKKPRWATLGTTLEPSEGQKDSGWVGGGQKPGYKTFNWLQKACGEWVSNLADVAASYVDTSEFIANAEPGNTGQITPDMGNFVPCGQVAASGAIGATIITMDGDGEFFYIATAAATANPFHKYDKTGTLIQTYTAARVATPYRIRANGSVVAAIYYGGGSGYLTVWDATTGVVIGSELNLGVFNIATDTIDLAIDNAKAYVTMSNGTVVRAFYLSNQILAWSTNVSNACSLDTDGIRVYVGAQGAMGGIYNVSSRMASFDCAAGTAVGEYLGSPVSSVLARGGIVTDGHRVLIITALDEILVAAVPMMLSGLAVPAHDEIEQAALPGSTTILGGFLEAEFVGLYGSLAGQSVIYMGKDMSKLDLLYGVQVTGEEIVTAYSDGEHIAYSNALATDSFVIHNRPRGRAAKWYRADPDADAFMPKRQLAYPLE
jgi:hypothetical protein